VRSPVTLNAAGDGQAAVARTLRLISARPAPLRARRSHLQLIPSTAYGEVRMPHGYANTCTHGGTVS